MAQEEGGNERPRPRRGSTRASGQATTAANEETINNEIQLDAQEEGGKTVTVEGTVIVSDGVVASIAGQAVEEVEGVSSVGTPSVTRSVAEALGAARSQTRGVSVQVGRTEAAFDLTIIVEYGYTIPDVAAKVKENVVRQVQTLTGLTVKRVNITVSDMQAPERVAQSTGIELQ